MKGLERASAAVGLLLCLIGLVWMFAGHSSDAVVGNANVVGGVSAVIGLGWLLLQVLRGQSPGAPHPSGEEGGGPPPGFGWPGNIPQRIAVSAIAFTLVVISVALLTTGDRHDARHDARPAAATVTHFVTPVDGARVPFHSSAELAISPSDADLHGSLLAMSVCVSGGCYLEEMLQIAGDRAAYDLYLGSDAAAGVGVAWTLRVDRLTTAEFTALRTEREQAIHDHTWGATVSTSMSGLNPTPVASVTVTKGP